MTLGKPIIHGLMRRRVQKGKEDATRIAERFGKTNCPRPNGPLMWIHVASVGEAQSVLILIDLFLKQNPSANVLVTSITTNSASLLARRLPPRAIHQYLPVDRPKWVGSFLDHWQPTLILWAESELWPIILNEISKRHLPMALINARISSASLHNWLRAPKLAEKILRSFTVILTQTDHDKQSYTSLGGRSVVTAGNIKFAAAPLPINTDDCAAFTKSLGNRPVWVYASTHEGEEELAIATHKALTTYFPNLLTVIIPRHPERRHDIKVLLEKSNLSFCFRGEAKKILPSVGTHIYVVDTMGELGLFYAALPLACIGRSFSDDGGGGHNPLEAALLHCAVLHGPHIQNLKDIYSPMDACGAAQLIEKPDDLAHAIKNLLTEQETLKTLQEKGYAYARSQTDVLNKVIEELEPLFLLANLPLLKGL